MHDVCVSLMLRHSGLKFACKDLPDFFDGVLVLVGFITRMFLALCFVGIILIGV